jgi:hypothetical protein
MGALAKKLTDFRRQEQEMRGYAASSRWYTGLSNAIHFLERAEGWKGQRVRETILIASAMHGPLSTTFL